jgi:hypothetical protein
MSQKRAKGIVSLEAEGRRRWEVGSGSLEFGEMGKGKL